MLFFNSNLKLVVGKLSLRWDQTFFISVFFFHGVVEIKDEDIGKFFKINRHLLKLF